MAIPTLSTERLCLRAFRDEDLDAYAELCADPEVMRFLGPTMGRAEAWRHMAMVLGHWQLRGFGLWAVELAASAQLVGRIGCWQPEGWPGLEVGWTLARPFWGHGYALEGARASAAWAFEHLGVTQVVSLIVPENQRSIYVAEALGETYAHDLDHFGRRHRVYSLTRETWCHGHPAGWR
jgi:RimJ/RimL family protein N-acetyltransferase